MYFASLVKGNTFHIYGKRFRRGQRLHVDKSMADKLALLPNFHIESEELNPGGTTPPDSTGSVTDDLKVVDENTDKPTTYTKAGLTELKKDEQVKILEGLGIDPSTLKNEGERVDAILATQTNA